MDDTKLMREFLVLALVNSVLVNIGKSKITKLVDFVDIDKQLLEGPSNKIIAHRYLSILLHYFSVNETKYYYKDSSKYYIIVLIKNLLKAINHKLVSKIKNFTISKGINAKKKIYRII